MSRWENHECAHCWRVGHTKRWCPERHRPHEELVAESNAYFAAREAGREAVAAAILQLLPECRVEDTVIAFSRACQKDSSERFFESCRRDSRDEKQIKDALEMSTGAQ